MRLRGGFTLIEALITTFVLASVGSALVYAIIQCSDLQETSRNLTIATSASQARIEQIRNTEFANIITNFDGDANVFDINGLDGKGRVDASYVSGSGSNLIDIRVAICWRQRGGRIMGEDNGAGGGSVLDGQLNGTEDADSDGEMDSPCVVYAAIANKRL